MNEKHIDIDETPESIEVLAVFEDGHEEHWSAGIPEPGKIFFLPPESVEGDCEFRTAKELKDFGVKRLYVSMYNTIDVDTLQ